MARFIDIHAEQRKALNLFQAVEPKVTLIGMTEIARNGAFNKTGYEEDDPIVDLMEPDEIPGFIARKSHGTEGKTPEENIALTKRLLTLPPAGHRGPFEFLQWVFDITGVSKSCLTQLDRARIGVGFVQMSGRYMDSSERGFVYNAYSYLPWDGSATVPFDESAKYALEVDAVHYQSCVAHYEMARKRKQTKQDARKNLPLAMASGTYFHANSVALRGLFNERLRPAAEWEVNRLCQLMFDIVHGIAPAHFEDIGKAVGVL